MTWKSEELRLEENGPLSFMEIVPGAVCITMIFDGPNQSVKLHSHSFDHMMKCISGRAAITIDDQTRVVTAGDSYMVEAHKRHGVRSLQPGTTLKCVHENADITGEEGEGIPAEWIYRLTDPPTPEEFAETTRRQLAAVALPG